jgi:hypothetical protein
MPPDGTLPVFDGESWPDDSKELEEEGIPEFVFAESSIVDVWKYNEERKVIEKKRKAEEKFRDVPHHDLLRLIGAIDNAVELRILPHVIREWHRRSFPVKCFDAQKIARCAGQFDEIEVIFQMNNPQVYGLFYDLKGMREIARALAKRTSSLEHEVGKKYTTPGDGMIALPQMICSAVGEAAIKIDTDAGILGTHLWAYVVRFNNDPLFRTAKSLREMSLLALEVVKSVREQQFIVSEQPDTIPKKEARHSFYAIKYKCVDYTPLLYALRQFQNIMKAPVEICLKTFRDSDKLSTIATHDLSVYINGQKSAALFNLPALQQIYDGRWIQLNQMLGKAVKTHGQGDIMDPWKMELLKQYTGANTPAYTTELFYLPLLVPPALAKVEEALREWKEILTKGDLKYRQTFKTKVIDYR